MVSEIPNHQAEIEGLCRKYHVKRLEAFGSAVTGKFKPESSDLDFLVEFLDLDPVDYSEAYFGLLEELEALFSRHVDLVTANSLSNPYFRIAVEREKAPVYAA